MTPISAGDSDATSNVAHQCKRSGALLDMAPFLGDEASLPHPRCLADGGSRQPFRLDSFVSC
jgi:hypothetical protein